MNHGRLFAALAAAFFTVSVLALSGTFLPKEDQAIRDTLDRATPPGELDRRVTDALEAGDIAGADQFASLAAELDKPLTPETQATLAEAKTFGATVVRNTGQFLTAYVTGEADTAAGLAGAVISDLTVVGDVRDLTIEGGKAISGQDYSEFLLAIAAVGLAAEGATLATGGGSLTLKAGASILKAAKRTGNLTVDFGRLLLRQAKETRLVRTLTRPARTSDTVAGTLRAARPETRAVARSSDGAGLIKTVGTIGHVAEAAGPAETVRLMRYVRTAEDLDDVAGMSARFGRNTRAVIELTGKTALRAFRVGVDATRAVFGAVFSFIAWMIGMTAYSLLKRGSFLVLDLTGRGLWLTTRLCWRGACAAVARASPVQTLSA